MKYSEIFEFSHEEWKFYNLQKPQNSYVNLQKVFHIGMAVVPYKHSSVQDSISFWSLFFLSSNLTLCFIVLKKNDFNGDEL